MSPARSRKPRLALVGPDSLRGKEILSVLAAKKFPLASLELFDPEVEEEYAKLGTFGGEAKVVHALSPAALEGLDLVFLAADERTNKRYGGLAAEKDYVALDLGGTFNADPKVPAIVAGVNDAGLRKTKPPLIANPSPAAIVLSHLLADLRAGFGVAKAVAFVLEPVSAYAEEGIRELAEQSYALLGSSAMSKKIFPEQVAFNLLTRTSKPDKNGFSRLENRVTAEIGRILGAGRSPCRSRSSSPPSSIPIRSWSTPSSNGTLRPPTWSPVSRRTTSSSSRRPARREWFRPCPWPAKTASISGRSGRTRPSPGASGCGPSPTT